MSIAGRIASRVREIVTFRAKASVAPTTVPAAAVGSGSSWVSVIRESFAGAWQKNVEIGPAHGLLAFSALYACIDLIANDVSKLRIKLVQLADGIWVETTSAAFSPVLRKPNDYQTRIQFLSQWIMSKLVHGNTFVLKQRDSRGVVVGLHVLNPRMVKVMVAEDGSVFYQLSRDKLAGMTDSPTVPADEIIHDRAICFFHPLIGVPPIFACGLSATQANKIQSNSTKFFENMSRPSGQLTAPGLITDETAARLKREFETNFGGENIGRLLVTGDGLKYEPMGTIPAQQSQLIEQLKWTVEDVARCFHVPLHKIASDTGVKYANMAEMNQDYYEQCLQHLIENIELLLDEGLGLAAGGVQTMGIELDLDGLLRLNPVQRAAVNESGVKAGVVSPNEARRALNLPKVTGGEEPYMQQQQFPLSVLAKQPAPGTMPAAAPAPAPAPEPAKPADPADSDPSEDDAVTNSAKVVHQVAELLDRLERQAGEMLTAQASIRAADEKAAEQRAKDAEAIRAMTDEGRAALADQLAQAKTLADEVRAVAAQRLELDQMTECFEFGQALIERLTNAEHLV